MNGKAKLAWLHIGSFSIENGRSRGDASSVPADLIQKNLLRELPKSGLPEPDILVYDPVQSFPRSRKLIYFGGRVRLPFGRSARTLGHFNLGPIKILTLGITAAIQTLRWGWRNRRAPRRLLTLYNLTAPPAAFVRPICRLLRIEVVPYVGDIYVPGETVPNSWLRRLEYRAQTKILGKVSGLIVCNQAIVDDFAADRKALLLDGGVSEAYLQRFDGDSATSNQAFTVVFAAELDDLDGIRLLLRAMPLLSGNDRIRLKVFGKGKYAREVEDAARTDERITYCGYVPYDKLLEAYRTADLLLVLRNTSLRTQRYFFPFKLVECLATGRPLLTTCTGHVRTEYGDFVWTLESETPEALAKAISEIAEMSPKDREETGKRARDYVRLHKTWEGQARKLADYLDDALPAEAA